MSLAKLIQRAADAIVTAATPDDTSEYQEPYMKYGKAFIADIAEILHMPTELLKPILVELNQQGLIRMHRADLVNSDEYDVRERSETTGPAKSTFHQVRGYRK